MTPRKRASTTHCPGIKGESGNGLGPEAGTLGKQTQREAGEPEAGWHLGPEVRLTFLTTLPSGEIPIALALSITFTTSA